MPDEIYDTGNPWSLDDRLGLLQQRLSDNLGDGLPAFVRVAPKEARERIKELERQVNVVEKEWLERSPEIIEQTQPPGDTVRLLPAKPEVIVLCGSSRFVAEMAVIAWVFERNEGVITMGLHLLPGDYTDAEDHLAEHEGVAERTDELHWRKIDLADKIFVVNIGGYIGDSTRAEIKYAERRVRTSARRKRGAARVDRGHCQRRCVRAGRRGSDALDREIERQWRS